MADKFLTYKGKPLVRKGDIIYYGDTAEEYIIMIKVLSVKDVGGIKVSDRVSVQLLLSDQELPMKDRVVKKSEKNGLYTAMDVGSIWLARALKNEQ